MLEVYSSNLELKMKVVFKIFDFNSDGLITPEDVKMILSYIPFC
jgi:hypothetical protein